MHACLWEKDASHRYVMSIYVHPCFLACTQTHRRVDVHACKIWQVCCTAWPRGTKPMPCTKAMCPSWPTTPCGTHTHAPDVRVRLQHIAQQERQQLQPGRRAACRRLPLRHGYDGCLAQARPGGIVDPGLVAVGSQAGVDAQQAEEAGKNVSGSENRQLSVGLRKGLPSGGNDED